MPATTEALTNFVLPSLFLIFSYHVSKTLFPLWVLLPLVAGFVFCAASVLMLFVVLLRKVETKAVLIKTVKEQTKTITERNKTATDQNKTVTDQNKTVEKGSMSPGQETKGFELEGLIKVIMEVDKLPKAAKQADWLVAKLKSNTLLCEDRKKTNSSKIVIVLNECGLKIIKRKRELFKVKNYIQLKRPCGKLYNLLFQTGHDMEEWYYCLYKAIQLASNSNPDYLRTHDDFFISLAKRHGPKSNEITVDWFNCILHRIFFNIHDQAGFLDWLQGLIQSKIDRLKNELPKIVTSIAVQQVYFGPNLPVLSDVRLLWIDSKGTMYADAKVAYYGGFKLVLELTFEVKLPFLSSITVPARLSVTVASVSGNVRFRVLGPPSRHFWIAFQEEPQVQLEVDTTFGSKHTLHNFPKLAAIVVSKIKQELIEMMVLPQMKSWSFPKTPGSKDKRNPIIEWEWEDTLQRTKNYQTKTVSNCKEEKKNGVHVRV